MAKIRSYNYLIEDEEEWKAFGKNYKKKGLGKNLNEALTTLIKKSNEEK